MLICIFDRIMKSIAVYVRSVSHWNRLVIIINLVNKRSVISYIRYCSIPKISSCISNKEMLQLGSQCSLLTKKDKRRKIVKHTFCNKILFGWKRRMAKWKSCKDLVWQALLRETRLLPLIFLKLQSIINVWVYQWYC